MLSLTKCHSGVHKPIAVQERSERQLQLTFKAVLAEAGTPVQSVCQIA